LEFVLAKLAKIKKPIESFYQNLYPYKTDINTNKKHLVDYF